ncbi:hypothetical protein RhiirA1_463235 [Rhizophagus irregularis]|uniref:Uncharacterized protein n=1 Tax=Rhizophagus irregularis TaxID=588596 RepID=A0A2I1EA30_9GLOM|nr:hypothetical protein RhiirA1_463235 [Rhizophagus irregularis]PKY18974.1 hypothetical protein RhiirB3_431893 [Rhizophagus irregularis]
MKLRNLVRGLLFTEKKDVPYSWLRVTGILWWLIGAGAKLSKSILVRGGVVQREKDSKLEQSITITSDIQLEKEIWIDLQESTS